MLKVTEKEGTLEIQSVTPAGLRVLFLFLAVFPLIAPYELLLQPKWESFFNLFFLFAAVISLGALTISGFLVWAAIAGLNYLTVFDRRTRMLTYTINAPVLSMRTSEYSIDSIDQLRIEKQDWSEGRPSYLLNILLTDGSALKIGSSWLRQELDAIAADIHTFLEK